MGSEERDHMGLVEIDTVDLTLEDSGTETAMHIMVEDSILSGTETVMLIMVEGSNLSGTETAMLIMVEDSILSGTMLTIVVALILSGTMLIIVETLIHSERETAVDIFDNKKSNFSCGYFLSHLMMRGKQTLDLDFIH